MKIVSVNKSLLKDIQAVVSRHFYMPVAFYATMKPEEYHGIVATCQTELNDQNMASRLVRDMEETICRYIGADDVVVQSNLYLRAARPALGGQESVGWHRETFYGCQKEAFNFWMPVSGVTPENSIKYIPGSDNIPDEDIVTEATDDPHVRQKSDGHKIGLLYAPKRIVSGVDLTRAMPMDVKQGQAVIFPQSLIHGAAENRTGEIRFSIDFRLMDAMRLNEKKQHFASGQEFFIPLMPA